MENSNKIKKDIDSYLENEKTKREDILEKIEKYCKDKLISTKEEIKNELNSYLETKIKESINYFEVKMKERYNDFIKQAEELEEYKDIKSLYDANKKSNEKMFENDIKSLKNNLETHIQYIKKQMK